MFTSVIAVISAFAASAAALPGAVGVRDAPATWTATGFEEGCSPGGCIASFNISAPAGYITGAPAFNVECHPIYIQQGWITCDANDAEATGSSVSSMWTDASERELIKISVSHIWTSGEVRYNASGFDEFAAGTQTFQVPVSSITAVA
ncbi:hypothetical protein GGR54DRAFT_329631 [Hypoxylon sp. NC1633]|nr:hypothetical protein GGR54DRAFT_329631 [Hypoxylon sp. NC1633]